MRQGSWLAEIEQRLDDFRRELFSDIGELERPMFGAVGVRVPATDVVEAEDQFVVTAELPGFDKKDVRIEIEPNAVVVRAQKARAREERPREGQRWLRRERVAEAFERVVSLPDEVSPDGAKATFRNGILEVTVPKTAPEKRRRRGIEID